MYTALHSNSGIFFTWAQQPKQRQETCVCLMAQHLFGSLYMADVTMLRNAQKGALPIICKDYDNKDS
ncbi:MAG: hypothetical protein ACXWJK_16325, partial [Burkholderiaceae bacterium]